MSKKTHTEIKWIKIATNLFADEKILLIEQMPDADTIIVIWFKLLCMAGRENNCGVFIMGGKIPYTDEMLATIFRRPLQTIRLALSTFEAFGMIEIIEDPSGKEVYSIPNWEKHQNTEGLDKIREQTRLRVAKHRENQRLSLGCNVTCNESVTECNATEEEKEKEKEKEEEKEEEKEKEKENDNEVSDTDSPNESLNDTFKAIIDFLNNRCGTNYKSSSKKTQSCIHARLKEGFTIDDFMIVIDKKSAEWMGTEYEKYLRPETLFGTKFEGYLNAKIIPKQSKSANIQNRVSNIDNW